MAMTMTTEKGTPIPLPSSIAIGMPPATAVNGAAAETTKKVIALTPSAFLRKLPDVLDGFMIQPLSSASHSNNNGVVLDLVAERS